MNNFFEPAWWLPNPHLQTLWPIFFRSELPLDLKTERFELGDGDFLDLAWCGKENGPIVILLHGFEGSIDSHYPKGMMKALLEQGWRCVFMHFRGCSGVPNRLARSYHSGDTADLATLVTELGHRYPNAPIAAIGYSLGGNVLLKWLGETGEHNPLTAAVAVSVPFNLQKTVKKMETGFSRIYQWHFLKCLRKRLLTKFQIVTPPAELPYAKKFKTLTEFDDQITAPLHGFKNYLDYYTKASCRPYLRTIQVPTLIIHAKDDPFMTPEVIPDAEEFSKQIKFELTDQGGHVGFISGKFPWEPKYWLEERIPIFLQQHLGMTRNDYFNNSNKTF